MSRYLLVTVAAAAEALAISGGTQLTPLTAGRPSAPAVAASSLWKETGGLEKAGGSPLPVFCVVKETEKPEEDEVPEEKMLGIAEFEDKYFCGPLYHDEERVFWQALGNKPIFTFGTLGNALINPLKARREMKEMGERFKTKGVEGNMVGDGLAKGGILVITPDDEVRHVFYEDPGNGVPDFEVAAIINAAKGVAAAAEVRVSQ